MDLATRTGVSPTRLPGLALAAFALTTVPAPAESQNPRRADAAVEQPSDTVVPLAPLTIRVLRWPLPVTGVPVAVSAIEPEPRARSLRLG
ncbi:MAG: hypothetical protein ACOC3J_06240, partial [Gemmatimonadota bacterium]